MPVPQGAYSPEFIAQVKALGLELIELSAMTTLGRRGTLAAVAFDPRTDKGAAANVPGVMVFNQPE